jgi:2-polyprenyl-6-methoxyphenol hydroxylase-like FAD-dependent oxidoreductase
MTTLKVFIVGAGVAGPAAAFWLSRLPGCTITVVESSPNLRKTGQQIDLRGQGIVLMKMMGIEKAVRAALCYEPGTRIIDSRGRSQGYVAANTSGKGRQTVTSEFEIMRGDLVNILYEETKWRENVEYVFDCQIKSFTQDEGKVGGKVHVTFSDGRKEKYDIVIGADGVNSKTRRLMLGPSFPDPRRDLGVHIAFFTAPTRESDTNEFTICHMPGGKILMIRKDKPENVRVYLMARLGCEKVDEARTLSEQKAALLELFKGSEGWQLDRFLRDMIESPEADDLYCHHEMAVRLPEGMWSRGQVVLLGDAANGSGANGFGTSSALIQAYVLCGEIATRWKTNQDATEVFNFQAAAQEFERIIRPIIKDRPSFWPKIMLPETKFGIWLMHTFFWLVTTLNVHEMLSSLLPSEGEQRLEYKNYFGLKS